MEASEPKWVNSVLNIIGVNSLRLESLHIISNLNITVISFEFSQKYKDILIYNINKYIINIIRYLSIQTIYQPELRLHSI